MDHDGIDIGPTDDQLLDWAEHNAHADGLDTTPGDPDYDDLCPDCAEWREHCHCDEPQICGRCGTQNCPGYCDDYQTYNLRPAETGGQQ